MNLEARLIRLKEKLDAKALRDPRTVKEYAIRNKWERVSNILRKRYKRYGDGIKVVVQRHIAIPNGWVKSVTHLKENDHGHG
jgi:hypothetical protein